MPRPRPPLLYPPLPRFEYSTIPVVEDVFENSAVSVVEDVFADWTDLDRSISFPFSVSIISWMEGRGSLFSMMSFMIAYASGRC